MTYKLLALNANKEAIGEYSGGEIITEEIVDKVLVIRLPFTPFDEEVNDPNSLFNKQLGQFINTLNTLKEEGAFGDKKLFIVPKNVEFMNLKKVDE